MRAFIRLELAAGWLNAELKLGPDDGWPKPPAAGCPKPAAG